MAESYSELVDATDQQLVNATMKGNMAAYDEIVRRYQQTVAASLYHFCKNQTDLEDLVQETFIRTYHKLHKWTPKAPLVSWIRRIGYNLSYDYLRKQKRNPLANRKEQFDPEQDENQPELQIADSATTADEKSDRSDLMQWLLEQLKPEEAMLVSMMYVEQMAVLEIAERLDWGESKVKVKIHRTRKKLKKLLESNEELKLQYSTTL